MDVCSTWCVPTSVVPEQYILRERNETQGWHVSESKFVYNQSIKRELKKRLIYENRCDERPRLKTIKEESTDLTNTESALRLQVIHFIRETLFVHWNPMKLHEKDAFSWISFHIHCRKMSNISFHFNSFEVGDHTVHFISFHFISFHFVVKWVFNEF
jgi:hypothetical protein